MFCLYSAPILFKENPTVSIYVPAPQQRYVDIVAGVVYIPSVLKLFANLGASEAAAAPGAVIFNLSSAATQACRRHHLSLQKAMPAVVFKKPIRTKKGMQTVAMAMPKFLKSCSEGMLVIPKTEVTNVKGRKKMET